MRSGSRPKGSVQHSWPASILRRMIVALLLAALWLPSANCQEVFPIGDAWARTKVNAVIFRRNAICSHGDRQVTAFYNADGHVVLAERQLGSDQWRQTVTSLTGRTVDAHNSISLAFDGDGILHVSWDHHASSLRYARTASADSLELSAGESMIGRNEDRVTYPEFYLLPDGDLLFFCRDGSSGSGNLVLNRYDVRRQLWRRLHDNLIDGEGQRNAYWQVAIDRRGGIHLSWVWRETGDVVTNHDICYARSTDGGVTWSRTNGQPCVLPISERTAEYAMRIPQNSELANQTSMSVDHAGNPVIANFWRNAPDAVPQYHLIRHDGNTWTTQQIGIRTLNFYRTGGGTKRPPVSRPLVLLDSSPERTRCCVLFRDLERGGGISAACSSTDQPDAWQFFRLTAAPVGQADPMIDPIVWQQRRQIHLLTQFAGQGDGEKQEEVPPQTISVVEWTPPGELCQGSADQLPFDQLPFDQLQGRD